MSLIYLDLEVTGIKKITIPVKCLFDSGASVSSINQRIADKLTNVRFGCFHSKFLDYQHFNLT